MKKLMSISLIALMAVACGETETPPVDNTEKGSILGRWIAEGFEDNIRYDFTADKRYTLYADSTRIFPSLEDFIRDNPGVGEHSYTKSGDTVVIDLNFGNYSKLVPEFKCENKVIDWIGEDGSVHSTYYREGHDISACN